MKNVDFLIAGSGLAGLTYAYKVAELFPDKKVCVLTKNKMKEANSHYAQGGIAAVIDKVTDSFESHIEDTHIAGAGLCKENVVEFVVREAPDRIFELIELGTPFDTKENGDLDLGLEGGHSHNRILHHKDSTGAAILNSLVRKVQKISNIEILEYCQVVDIIKQDESGECLGLYVILNGSDKVTPITSSLTLLATGGACQVYPSTTNPKIATGDGIAIASRAGADISHMEFIQFHPTSLFQPEISQVFLISEALRGAGAVLKNHEGREFMYDYDPRGPLAPRDIVARAIESEMRKTEQSYVYLDARHIVQEKLLAHFPNIYKRCLSRGIDLFSDMIPVVPAAHYTCGGIETDEFGQTSISRLFACGECAYTGLHGANRLASNSLLEALVFAHRAAQKSKILFESRIDTSSTFTNQYGELVLNDISQLAVNQLKQEVRQVAREYAGINRQKVGLAAAKVKLDGLEAKIKRLHKESPSWKSFELINLLVVAQLIVRDAFDRKESVGAHFISTEASLYINEESA
ncbi:L-aspartate oxidase [Flammeovirgaceae bacterium SG7u.111]|nr:L-aspartate oxidase [Flammeovirgaceae bacterium SG7u.132]WPO37767.1 L-aspartate oxidase [Flammeovirgaceae bacterium SG7u.111]